jgi:hypothetical protein
LGYAVNGEIRKIARFEIHICDESIVSLSRLHKPKLNSIDTYLYIYMQDLLSFDCNLIRPKLSLYSV